jgi:N-acetyl-alpha-D-muramate 1-phosphate uridylyltransferase
VIAALVLAAGEGTRLRPITATIPKALCPIGNVALLDRALARLAANGFAGPAEVAVNACYLAPMVTTQVAGRARVSVEPGPRPYGTGGAIPPLRDWIGERGLLVGNADAYMSTSGPDLDVLLAGWSYETVRILCIPAGDRAAEFGDDRFAGFSLLPPSVIAALPAGPSDLFEAAWRPAEQSGRLEIVRYEGLYLDTGTPADFLAANLHACGDGSLVAPSALVAGTVSHSAIGPGAQVLGSVTRSVVFPGGVVGPEEDLVDAIRVGADVTVNVPGTG